MYHNGLVFIVVESYVPSQDDHQGGDNAALLIPGIIFEMV